MVLLLLTVLGGAVLGGQIIVQQRLSAAGRRQSDYRRRVAAEAAILQVLAQDILFGNVTSAIIRVPLPAELQVSVAWEPVTRPDGDKPATATRIQAIVSDGTAAAAAVGMEGRVRPAHGRWILSERREL